MERWKKCEKEEKIDTGPEGICSIKYTWYGYHSMYSVRKNIAKVAAKLNFAFIPSKTVKVLSQIWSRMSQKFQTVQIGPKNCEGLTILMQEPAKELDISSDLELIIN